jgi:DNA polymerase III subunit gamma/tau
VALDTRYRPLRFDDVIGQDASVKVLRQFIRTGTGFHQSYVFCGFHGGGKTTLGRILARGLLCEAPVDGNPCDQCASCRSILERGTSECFTEFDAATNSGKDDIRSIVETLNYDTFSGKRRIYLMDEAHRLSKDALDALLKPMEDTVRGSEDKMLVCIFCTTEPERMRSTIFSRCAPAFVIRRVTPEKIADRLAYVADQEGIPYDRDALVLIAEATECHIRDGLKSLEGVSMLGGATMDNVRSYLRLNVNAHYLDILVNIGTDLTRVLELAELVTQSVSPATAYERLAEAAMLAYRTSLGAARPPSYWSRDVLDDVARRHGDHLVGFADTFAARPGNPVAATLSCDLAVLHHNRAGSWVSKPRTIAGPVPVPAPAAPTPAPAAPTPAPAAPTPVAGVDVSTIPAPPQNSAPTLTGAPNTGTVKAPAPVTPPAPYVNEGGVYINPRAVGRRAPEHAGRAKSAVPPMGPAEFRGVLARLVQEFSVDGGGSSA